MLRNHTTNTNTQQILTFTIRLLLLLHVIVTATCYMASTVSCSFGYSLQGGAVGGGCIAWG